MKAIHSQLLVKLKVNSYWEKSVTQYFDASRLVYTATVLRGYINELYTCDGRYRFIE